MRVAGYAEPVIACLSELSALSTSGKLKGRKSSLEGVYQKLLSGLLLVFRVGAMLRNLAHCWVEFSDCF